MARIVDPAGERYATVSATDAKNGFGAVLDRVMTDGGVAITKHAEVKAVLLSVAKYEALVAAQPDPLSTLAEEFDGLVDRMTTPAARRAGRVLFEASPSQLGRAAAKRRGRG